MDRSQKIQGAYKASKNIYDHTLTQEKWWARLYIRFFWGGVDDFAIARRVLDMLPRDFAGRLLDVPVGTAVFTAEAYASLPHAEIVCLDYSEDMLTQARARLAEYGATGATCIQGDVGALPFGDEDFDIVLSMNGFHAFPSKNKAFAETARVLKSGGTFCGCFYIRGQNSRTDFVVRRFLAPKGWFTPPFYTLEELRAQLAKHYSEIDIWNDQAMVCFRCVK